MFFCVILVLLPATHSERQLRCAPRSRDKSVCLADSRRYRRRFCRFHHYFVLRLVVVRLITGRKDARHGQNP